MPRIELDSEVKVEAGAVTPAFDARVVNLSVGGLFVESGTLLAPGAHVVLKVDLRDGGMPVDAEGEVVWVREEEVERGMALRFVDLDETSTKRIARLVAARRREPTGRHPRNVRIHLPSLPSPLRAVARDQTDQGIMLEAELPWLKLGSAVTTELSPDRAVDGRVRWVGLDVTRSGSARLRIFVDLVEEEAGARPVTLQRETPSAQLPPTAELPRARGRRSWPALLGAGAVALAAAAAVWLAVPRWVIPAPNALPVAAERDAVAPVRPTLVAIPKSKPEPPPAPSRSRKSRRH